MDWTLFIWTLILLVPLLWIVRWVHEGLQELFFLLTEHKLAAIYLFQILLLPGVILHELSHYLTAKLLGVRVREVSLKPEIHQDRIQMGAVVMDRPDLARSLVIGLAPMIVGSIAVVLIGQQVFDVGSVIEAAKSNDVQALAEAVYAAFGVNDAWIWFYLIFAVSNAMLPSESDREALGPMLAFIAVGGGIVALAGWGPAVLSSLAGPVETGLSLLMVAFGITLFVDIMFLGVILLLKQSFSLLTGRRLQKGA
jgi:hypothetical protein